jgi:hypothetical protein
MHILMAMPSLKIAVHAQHTAGCERMFLRAAALKKVNLGHIGENRFRLVNKGLRTPTARLPRLANVIRSVEVSLSYGTENEFQ